MGSIEAKRPAKKRMERCNEWNNALNRRFMFASGFPTLEERPKAYFAEGYGVGE